MTKGLFLMLINLPKHSTLQVSTHRDTRTDASTPRPGEGLRGEITQSGWGINPNLSFPIQQKISTSKCSLFNHNMDQSHHKSHLLCVNNESEREKERRISTLHFESLKPCWWSTGAKTNSSTQSNSDVMEVDNAGFVSAGWMHKPSESSLWQRQLPRTCSNGASLPAP